MAALLKKGLIGAIGLVAAAALARTNAPTWLLFGTAAVFLVVVVRLDWLLATKNRRMGLGGLAFVYGLLLALVLWTAPDGISVTINCTPVCPLPLRGVQGDSLLAIYLDPKWGNRLVSVPSVSWPDWATPNDVAYRCELVNNGVLFLHGVSLVLVATFHGEGLPATRQIAITSPTSVEPQRPVAFYIADDTRRAKEVVPPANIVARVGEDREPRSIQVHYSTIDGHPVRLRGFNP